MPKQCGLAPSQTQSVTDVTSTDRPFVIAIAVDDEHDVPLLRRKPNRQWAAMTYTDTPAGRRAADDMMGSVRLAIDGAWLMDVRRIGVGE